MTFFFRLLVRDGRFLGPVAVDADEQPCVAADELERDVPSLRELLVRFEPVEHPRDRRRHLPVAAEVDGARDDQPFLRPRHRDVVEAQALGPLRLLARLLHRLVVKGAAALRRHRIRDAESEAAVGQGEDLVRRRRHSVAPGVGDDHDLELETLRGVNRQQAHRVGPLLLGHRLELACADRLLLGDEPDEALDVGPAQLFVGARQARELPHVGVAPAAVPQREHGEVVVVLRHDLLAQPLEREPRHRLD